MSIYQATESTDYQSIVQISNPRVGLFGGTFNPIHNGHLALAENALISLKLNAVIFIPSNVSPFKIGTEMPSKQHRINMLKLAIQYNEHFLFSDYEINKDEISYSINTVKFFINLAPVINFVLLVGADSFEHMDKWKEINELCTLVEFGVFNRGKAIKAPSGIVNYSEIKGEFKNISSTNVRDRIKNNFPVNVLLPLSVEKYISENGLYQSVA